MDRLEGRHHSPHVLADVLSKTCLRLLLPFLVRHANSVIVDRLQHGSDVRTSGWFGISIPPEGLAQLPQRHAMSFFILFLCKTTGPVYSLKY